jgi:hypothetical protein
MWFCMPARGKTVIPHLILFGRLWRGRPWRPALRRRVQAAPVMEGPSMAMETGAHSAPSSHPLPCIFSPSHPLRFGPILQTLAAARSSQLLPSRYPSRRHCPSPAMSLPHRRPMGGAWDGRLLLHGADPRRLLASPLSVAVGRSTGGHVVALLVWPGCCPTLLPASSTTSTASSAPTLSVTATTRTSILVSSMWFVGTLHHPLLSLL